jgi:NADH-quinone oxidoreductase subunit H
MNPLVLLETGAEAAARILGDDPWWMVVLKVVVVVVFLLTFTIFNVWYERRVVGKMQHRKGPIMNGPFGLAQALGDGVKLLLKEDFRPAGTDRFVFNLAPIITGTAAFTAWSVMPIGGRVTIFGEETLLQLTDLPMGVLFVLSVASVGIYGIVLAGWSSTSPYSLVGGVRSTAQMISYEIAMGLSLVTVFLYSGSMSTAGIVVDQSVTLNLPGFLGPDGAGFPGWYAVLCLPAFVIYFISMVAETNRAPFDLVECEQELVSGYITDYSGFRYAIYFLAEYINMATVSGIATTLFLGGYHAPWPFNDGGLIDNLGATGFINVVNHGWFSPIWFLIKVLICIFVFVWLRGTLPRFRYDQFMNLGWRWLLPISLVWIVLTASVKVVAQQELLVNSTDVMIVAGIVVVILIGWLVIDSKKAPDEERSEVSRVPEVTPGEFNAFASGYPVPPMPGQELPEFAHVVAGEAISVKEEPVAAATEAEGK